MDVIMKVNNESNGRDKIARLFQYTSRIVWHQLELRKADKYSVDRIRGLESSLSSFRKLLRLGRCVDVCYTALNSLHIEDPVLRHTLTLSRIARALFLFSDHIVWLSKSGYIRTDSDNWNKTANRFWLLSIIANLARDLYEIFHILDIDKSSLLKPSVLLNSKHFNSPDGIKHLLTIVECHKDVFIDTLKNSCDLLIPLTALGYTKFSPSTIGVVGAVSSIAALVTIVKPITKLVPA